LNIASRVSRIPLPLAALIQLLAGVDWWLIMATAFLVAVGLSTLKWSQQTQGYFDKQIDFIWVGIFLLLIFSRIPPKIWTQKFVVAGIYVVNLILLIAVMVKGHTAQGAQRWLAVGPITLQPSEIAKLVVIFTLAAWLGRRPIKSFWHIFLTMVLILPPAVLVFKQPDLGTSLTFGAVFLGMTYWAGANVSDLLILASPLVSLILNAVNQMWWLGFIGFLGVWLLFFWRRSDWKFLVRLSLIAVILLGNFGIGKMRPQLWGLLKEYQQKRLTSFVNPYEDPRGSGYHILQSLIAIGSGGLNGTGLGKGNQSQGAFIPERHTDFIFAVVGEELGFKISVFVIVAYGIICLRGVATANQCKEDPVGGVMAIGLTCLFLFHVFLNVGMTMGIMPVAGVPLPFLSYGGTALLVDLVSIGLLQAIQFANPRRIEH
jgi:rod shape determining protein RodA